MRNTFINNGNGTTTVILKSKIHGEKHILVDTDMVPVIEKYTWCVVKTGKAKNIYAATTYITEDGKKKFQYMHKLINGTPTGYVTDHIDHNGLNNTRSNLRTVTNKQNLYNRANVKGYVLIGKKYRACIMLDKKFIHIGMFETAEAARAAYLEAKKEFHKI